jgi:hypothetical protein
MASSLPRGLFTIPPRPPGHVAEFAYAPAGNLLSQAFRGRISGDGRSLTGEVINYACGAFTAWKR